MDCPLTDLMDEASCFDFLCQALHPDGLRCPRCHGADYRVHRSAREAVLDYRCGRVFNAWTGTAVQGTHKSPAELVRLGCGLLQGTPTARLARELDCDRKHLLELRHRLQELARQLSPRARLPDTRAEADEMFQNAGEEGAGTPTRTTHRGGGPTTAVGWGRSPTTGRRSAGWSGGRADGYTWRC